MYQIVAPILYDEPIVQNVGLFFLGVEQPIIGRNEPDNQEDVVSQSKIESENESETKTGTAQLIPYHKRRLLDFVKKINIIRVSSSTPLDRCYMEYSGSAWYSAYISDTFLLKATNCDRLAREEIEGWVLAGSLLERLAEQSENKIRWQCAFPFISFRNLAVLTFGLWDDGRWVIYQNRANTRQKDDNARITRERRRERFADCSDDSDDSEEETDGDDNASAYAYCGEIVAAFFFRTLSRQAVSLCHHTTLGLDIFDTYIVWPETLYRSHGSRLCPVEGLRVTHGSLGTGYEQYLVNAGPTRVFAKYNQNGGHGGITVDEIPQLHSHSFLRSTAAYVKRYPDRLPDGCHSDMTLRLDLCLLPETEGADDMPEEAQIRRQIEAGQIEAGQLTPMDEVIRKDKEESDALEKGLMKLGSTRGCREELFWRSIPLNIYIGDDAPPCPACGLKE
jgi:hypothetical protein